MLYYGGQPGADFDYEVMAAGRQRAALRAGESESAAHLLNRAPAMGDLVLFLAGHLCVGAQAGVAVGDEDGVVAEPGGAARLGGQGAIDGSLEDADPVGSGVAECGADGGATVGESRGHGEDALGPTVSRNQETRA